MTLPTSRNTTYTPASQILDTDLNALQDCIIGHKHGLLEFSLDIALASSDNATLALINSNGYRTGAIGVVRFPIVLPAGTRIVSYEQFYSVNGTGVSFNFALKRQDITTAGANTVDGPIGTGTVGGAGVVATQLRTVNHVMLAGNTYFVETTTANNGHRVHGVRLMVDRL